jgi:hypothetical protein
MGKKNKKEIEPSEKRGKKGIVPFSFLNVKFDNINQTTVKRHIIFLIIASLVTKLLVIFITTSVFHSFVDLFDIGYYYDHGILLIQGQIPYLNFSIDYPILVFVPICLALIPAMIFQNVMAFVYSFQFLMVLCDLVTLICVYLIGLKLWDERTAFYSGLLCAIAFSAAYFVITKYDAFPTVLLMLAITFTLYNKTIEGYAAAIIGFFAKIFPIIAFPFFVMFNSKGRSFKQELIVVAKIVIPVSVVFFLPFFLLNPEILKIYVPVRSEFGYYSNTLTFTIYSWMHDIFKIGISIDTISAIMYVVMGLGLLLLVYIAYKTPEKNPKLLIKLLLCAIILLVICAKVRSPQYIVWFTPLICILAIDDIKKIALLLLVQVLAYIEFPLMFGAFYTANSYTAPVFSAGWQLTLIIFTLEYFALLVCVWFVVNPIEMYREIRKVRD